MIVEFLNKVTSAIVTTIDLVATFIINIVAVPLSLAYTAVSHTLSRKWQLSDISGVYYFWCSSKERIIKCSTSTGLSDMCSTAIKYPRMLMVLFVLAAIPLILAAVIRTITSSDNSAKSDVIDVEVITEEGKNENKN